MVYAWPDANGHVSGSRYYRAFIPKLYSIQGSRAQELSEMMTEVRPMAFSIYDLLFTEKQGFQGTPCGGG